MSNFNFIDNSLVTSTFIVDFESRINAVEKIDDVYLVLLDVEKGSIEVDNVRGVDDSGRVIWKIQNVEEAFGIMHNTPYIYMKALDSSTAQVTSFYGMRFTFDIHSGKMIKKECIRW